MNPLQPTKVFIPATWKDNDYVLCIDDMMGYIKSSEVPYVKEKSLYCFSKEEMQEYNEEKDNFAISFAIWCLYDPQAKAYIESKVTASQLLSLYKDRPFINPDQSLQ